MSGGAVRGDASEFRRSCVAALQAAGLTGATSLRQGSATPLLPEGARGRGSLIVGTARDLVLMCRTDRVEASELGAGCRDAHTAASHLGAKHSAAVFRRRGHEATDAFVVMPLSKFAEMLHDLTTTRNKQTERRTDIGDHRDMQPPAIEDWQFSA